jgi:hypothetical protein
MTKFNGTLWVEQDLENVAKPLPAVKNDFVHFESIKAEFF